MLRHHLDDFRKGWIIGDFEPSLCKTKAFEAGLKIHRKDEEIERHFHKEAFEYNIMVCGEMRINGQHLKANDVFIFEPGECVHAEVLTSEARVMVIKMPSLPGDKYSCEHS